MDPNPTPTPTTRRLRGKIVVIMGPTGSGKSKLSIDLATRFYPQSEIINSDKIQVYRGLDITTNKITMQDRLGVPHYHLGDIDPTEPEFTPHEFRSVASSTISDIISRRALPLIVGGSISFIYALLTKRFEFFDPISSELRYTACFIWIHVSLPVLNQYLSKRVDEMMESGMLSELTEFYNSGSYKSVNPAGLGKAIGIPEFEKYFKSFADSDGDELTMKMKMMAYEEAVKAVKENTCELAKRQSEKIERLKEAGWNIHKIDATEAFRALMEEKEFTENWEKKVVEPSVKIVNHFLEE